MQQNVLPAVSPWRVDTSRGSSDSRLSSQWFSRPSDQRFVTLEDLRYFVHERAEQSFQNLVDVRDIEVRAQSDDPNTLRLVLPGRERGELVETEPTHWSFGQMCSLLQVPASYLRRLPAFLGGANLMYAVKNFREENIKAYTRVNGRTELRAATGPDYGRVHDWEVVDAVARVNARANGRFKVPGMFNWSTMLYDPNTPITKESTTLFASDRDVFMFLVDDLNPIEIGKLDNGDPDYVMRGYMVWNSEVGSKSLGIATFLYRGSCCNRILWGIEEHQEITLRHSKNAPMRFDGEVTPALLSYVNDNTGAYVKGIRSAKEAIVARSDDDREEFLLKQKFTKPESKAIMAAVLQEEGVKPESVWDFVQGITAVARGITHQDDRVAFEKRAGALMRKVA